MRLQGGHGKVDIGGGNTGHHLDAQIEMHERHAKSLSLRQPKGWIPRYNKLLKQIDGLKRTRDSGYPGTNTNSHRGEGRGPGGHTGKGVSQDGTTNRNAPGGIGGGHMRGANGKTAAQIKADNAREERERIAAAKSRMGGGLKSDTAKLAYGRAAGTTTQGAVKRPNITNVNSQESGGNTYPKKRKRG